MRKSILSLVATLAIAGCVKSEIAAPVYELGFEPEEVVATLDDDETKTSLGSTGSVLWSQADHITVLYKGTKYAMSYKVKEGVGTNQATFSYDAEQGFYLTTVETEFTKYYGFYPALATDTVPMDADGKLQVTIPATQSYAKESFDATAAVMTGSSTTTDIPFKNATGLLKIFLTPSVPGTPGFCKVQSIIVSSASEKLLAGAAYIDTDNAAVIKEDGVSAVTLNCGGAALDESESFREYVGNAFIFALPPTVFGEDDLTITINLLNADGTAREAVVKTVSQTFTVARTKIAVVPVSYDSLEDIHGGIDLPVAQIGDDKYNTLADALKAATSGATIEILNGTWGADAIGKLDETGYTNANIVRYKSLTIQPAEGATPTFTANVSLGYDDSSTANATMTVKGLKFDGASLQLSNYVQATVENCQFVNGTAATNGVLVVQDACCKNHKTEDVYPDSQITIKNCSIDGSNTGTPAIRLRNSGSVTIDGCTVANSQHNGILFESNGSVNNTPAKTILIKDNAITEWNSTNTADSGRGMRMALGTLVDGSTVTLSGNTFTKATLGFDAPDFAKITGMGDGSLTLSGNSWNTMTDEDVRDNADYFTCDEKIYGYRGVILPAAPTVSGDVINVTAANAQYTLDGAYGPIDGKTINFTESIEEKLVLGRPNKFAGSNTVYRHGSFDKETMSYKDYIAYKTQPGWTEGGYYNRAISNVTFTAQSGVELAGFIAEGGAHVSGTATKPIYDYVRDTGIDCYDTNNGYFVYTELTNIKFSGLIFTGGTAFDTSSEKTTFDNIEFNGCTFNINNTADNSANIAIHYYSEGPHGKVKNLIVKNCNFNECRQGVYTAKVVGIHLEGNTVATTGHNAFAIQNSATTDPGCGTVVIKDNIITGCGDRAIRFNYINVPADITITGNDAKYGDGVTPSGEEAIKATSIAAGVTVTADNNNWNNYKEPYNDEFKNPVAKIGTKGYVTLGGAFSAVKSGETIQIVKAGEYTVETIPGKEGVPFNIEATVEGVVFKHTAGYGKWVASEGGLRTIKNITLNIGEASYQYASNINFENCKIIGLLCSHVQNTFTDCDFVCETGYNMWAYGSPCTFVRCSFKCSGTNGGAINAYNESKQATTTALVFTDCTFEALNQSNKYAAVYIKPETGFDVTFTNCTANENFKPGDKSNESRLWNVKDNTNTDHKVTVDGVVVYENGALK